jgi:hypothetical protein
LNSSHGISLSFGTWLKWERANRKDPKEPKWIVRKLRFKTSMAPFSKDQCPIVGQVRMTLSLANQTLSMMLWNHAQDVFLSLVTYDD